MLEVVCRQMVGVMLVVYARASLVTAAAVRVAHCDSCGVGLLGAAGNKGGVAASLTVYDSRICLVSSHLAAHDRELERRNADYHDLVQNLLRGGRAAHVLAHDCVLWLGDLNYRIELTRDEIVRRVNCEDWKGLMASDQLQAQIMSFQDDIQKGMAFRGFSEADIAFAPTYKYDPGTQIYDSSKKMRSPAFCDRILWRMRPSPFPTSATLKSLHYGRRETVVSDHRPVVGLFVFVPAIESLEGKAEAVAAARGMMDASHDVAGVTPISLKRSGKIPTPTASTSLDSRAPRPQSEAPLRPLPTPPARPLPSPPPQVSRPRPPPFPPPAPATQSLKTPNPAQSLDDLLDFLDPALSPARVHQLPATVGAIHQVPPPNISPLPFAATLSSLTSTSSSSMFPPASAGQGSVNMFSGVSAATEVEDPFLALLTTNECCGEAPVAQGKSDTFLLDGWKPLGHLGGQEVSHPVTMTLPTGWSEHPPAIIDGSKGFLGHTVGFEGNCSGNSGAGANFSNKSKMPTPWVSFDSALSDAGSNHGAPAQAASHGLLGLRHESSALSSQASAVPTAPLNDPFADLVEQDLAALVSANASQDDCELAVCDDLLGAGGVAHMTIGGKMVSGGAKCGEGPSRMAQFDASAPLGAATVTSSHLDPFAGLL